MRVALALLLGVLFLIAASAVRADTESDDCSLTVYNNGCYYPGTCVRTWGSCPDYSNCEGRITLGTNERCKPVCVGFGVYSDCYTDLSSYNQLHFGAKLCVEGDINKCAILIKIELEDYQCKKSCAYLWLTPDCHDYTIVLTRFKCLNLCKIKGIFLITVFDVISYDECKEVTVVIFIIKFIKSPYYTVFDDCSDYQYQGKYQGPVSLYYWPGCLPCPAIYTNCEGYGRVLGIPCGQWGAGFLGYSQDLSCFKYLTFYLKSTVQTKIEIGDECGTKASYCYDSTCGGWKCVKIALCEFHCVNLSKVTWQFLITKVGCSNESEVKVANIRYTYC